YIPDLGVQVQGNGLATTRAFIRSNREVVKAALKGYIEAIHFIFQNKQASQRVFAKYMRTDDSDVLVSSYQTYIKDHAEETVPNAERTSILIRLPGAANAAGKDRKA